MDYPVLNLLFGLVMVLATVVSAGLWALLANGRPRLAGPRGGRKAIVSGLALAANLLTAACVGYLLVQPMVPAMRGRLGLGVLVLAGLGGLVLWQLRRVEMKDAAGRAVFGLQLLCSGLGIVIGLGLLRSLVAIGPGAAP